MFDRRGAVVRSEARTLGLCTENYCEEMIRVHIDDELGDSWR
jgi:hypothetical protein